MSIIWPISISNRKELKACLAIICPVYFGKCCTSLSIMDLNAFSEDSSDDEWFQERKNANTPKKFEDALRRLNQDYFGATLRYGRCHIERRFRIPRDAFYKIEEKLVGRGILFKGKML